MITTRSLLPDALTASWIELKVQRLKSLRFRSMKRRGLGGGDLHARLRRAKHVAGRLGAVDRLLSALQGVRLADDLRARVGERGLERCDGVGTCPPAHGETEQSGAGSGQ